MCEAKFNFVPLVCPNCGRSLFNLHTHIDQVSDFIAGVPHTCDCGLGFQYVATLTHGQETSPDDTIPLTAKDGMWLPAEDRIINNGG